jgi:hypothetical protein
VAVKRKVLFSAETMMSSKKSTKTTRGGRAVKLPSKLLEVRSSKGTTNKTDGSEEKSEESFGGNLFLPKPGNFGVGFGPKGSYREGDEL